MNRFLYRVIDANMNRVREGLRVCEEFVRFFANDKALTKDFKKIRNKISGIYNRLPGHKRLMLEARDSAGDAGRAGFTFERKRARLEDLFWANLQRSKEALRVLEEFFKLEKKEISDEFRRLRFHLYETEKKAFKKLRGTL
jgi:thiamine-phosphate pyrophosphorylase